MRIFSKIIYTILILGSLIFAAGFTTHVQNPVVLQITQVDTSDFPLVRVYISVRDEKGEPLAINPAKLVLKENGVPINPESIQGADVVNELTSLLVVDVSGSMSFAGKLDAAKQAAKDYFRQLRPDDKAGIVTFNTKVIVVQSVTGDQLALLKGVDKIQARDDTAMYDALMKAVQILNPLAGRKAIIVLTDGMDNASVSTSEDVLKSIGFKGLSISTVGLGIVPEGENPPDIYKGLDQAGLTMLAERAGGRYGFVEDKQSLAQLYDQMRRAMQSEIVITYTTPIALRDGVSRALTVSLADELTGIGATGQKNFNPGGLVPEVAQPVSWVTFAIIFVFLLALLVVPMIVRSVGGAASKTKRKKKTRIKLLD